LCVAVSLGIVGSELVAAVTGEQAAASGGSWVVFGAALVACLFGAGWWWLADRRGRRAEVGEPVSVGDLSALYGPAAVLDATVVAVGDALDRSAATSSVPLAIHVGDDVVEVFWDRPPPAVTATFRAAATGWVWTTTPAHLVRHVPRRDGPALAPPPLLPALVAVGATGFGELYLNLEGCGLINLVGELAHAERVFEHLLAEVQVAMVDVLIAGPRNADRDRVLSSQSVSVDAALMEARSRRARLRRDLEDNAWRSVLGARRRDPTGGRWRPLVVAIADAHGDPETLGRLARAARGDRSGVICVFVNFDPDAETVAVECGDGVLSLPFLDGIDVVLPGRPASEERVPCSEDAETLSPARSALPPVPVAPSPSVSLATSSPVPAAPEPATSKTAGLEVRLLGPVEVLGTCSPLGGKSVELVAYLACHRDGVSDDRIKTVLWPQRPVAHKTWLNRVSACRHALGTDAAGEPSLPNFEDGIGRLATSVVTDIAELESALHATRDQTDQSSVETLRAALTRVRGRPFEERSGYEWAFAEFHVAHAERIVTEVAQRLAALALAAGEWETALWAAERGLLAVPASELLAQDRMRAFAAGGDLRGVQAALRDLLASVDSDDPVAALHPDTIELYERLCGPARTPSGWSSTAGGGG
jgi:hypothetical protein